MPRTIIVSNRLPVKIRKDEKGEFLFEPSAGGLATGLNSVYKDGGNIWIGWPGITVSDTAEQRVVTRKLRMENMHPVFLTEKDIEMFYLGFSNKTLWPNFHYFPQYSEYKSSLWASYIEVNRMFAEEVLSFARPNDRIWIHDYQLMLLPAMLRVFLPDATIGYFQHIPFPSYEVFRMLASRHDLLEGLLGADLIGFHTYDDMRHFLSAANRILGVDHHMGHIDYNDRTIMVDAIPMGIDYERFQETAKLPGTVTKMEAFQKSFKEGTKVVLSVDRLDYSKGIRNRLRAIEVFFERYPEFIEKVTFTMVVVPSRARVQDYKELKIDLDQSVGRINGTFGTLNWTPVLYFYRSFDFEDLVALYRLADICLVTSLRDGMNLVAKEYIACKVDQDGVLVLSEMAGASKELLEAIQINPHAVINIVNSIQIALNLPEAEKINRMQIMQDHVKKYTVFQWVQRFMDQLDSVKDHQTERKLNILTPEATKTLIQDYQSAKSRLIFLDYDGTLMPFSKNPDEVVPDDQVKRIVEQLSQQADVVIISGRPKNMLRDWFEHYNVHLCAEHGVWYKRRDQHWKMLENLLTGWKSDIRQYLEHYVDRTPGSFIEEKDYSLAWHYRKADSEFGKMRSRELCTNLQYLTQGMNLSVLDGNKVVEVKVAGINKGRASMKWTKKQDWDFVFAIGDDRTDEDTFLAMPDHAYTIKVGDTATEAKYNVKSYKNVRRLLEMMAGLPSPEGE
ncbi:MAG: bifunctional alpha,alpha-trehalose-phosphate synthase (UDP-forming)/trehalose-phosphatase [Bacteroidota bacterium]